MDLSTPETPFSRKNPEKSGKTGGVWPDAGKFYGDPESGVHMKL
jgi:hypothetical protein